MRLNKKTLFLLLGPVTGFGLFIANTISVENVYERPDHNGDKIFTLNGLKQYLKAPFMIGTEQCKTVWAIVPDISLHDRLSLLQLNWVFMVGIGTFVSACTLMMI